MPKRKQAGTGILVVLGLDGSDEPSQFVGKTVLMTLLDLVNVEEQKRADSKNTLTEKCESLKKIIYVRTDDNRMYENVEIDRGSIIKEKHG